MITLEQLEKAFGDDRQPFQNRGIDHDVTAISLLRERIPYESCKNIIDGAEHDVLYLCDIEYVIEFLSEEDLQVLADCNCWHDEDAGCLALFV